MDLDVVNWVFSPPGFNGDCVPCTGLTAPPFVSRTSVGHRGILVEFLFDLAIRTNSCFNLTIPKPITFNTQFANFTGELLWMKEKKVEFSISYRGRFYELKDHFDFSIFIFTSGRTAVMKYPTLEPNMLGLVQTFTPQVWCFVLLAFITSCFVFHVIKKVQYQYIEQVTMKSTIETSGSFFIPLKIVLSQANMIPRLSVMWKIYFWGILAFSLILGLSYKCNLKAMLIAQKVALPFTNIEEMANQNEVIPFTGTGTQLKDLIKALPETSLLGKVGKKFDPFLPPKKSLVDISNTIYTGKYFLLVVSNTAKGLTAWAYAKEGRCTMTVMKEEFLTMISSIYFTKGSPWRNLINSGIVAYREMGLLEKSENDFFGRAVQCFVVKTNHAILRPLALEDHYRVFIVYLAGNLVAMVCFWGEKLVLKASRTSIK